MIEALSEEAHHPIEREESVVPLQQLFLKPGVEWEQVWLLVLIVREKKTARIYGVGVQLPESKAMGESWFHVLVEADPLENFDRVWQNQTKHECLKIEPPRYEKEMRLGYQLWIRDPRQQHEGSGLRMMAAMQVVL
eukprot:TRINITY_DN286_c0_g1_i13.p1 TRINITY_DN286_c0_g1~~TRINITY_DN286_c0_g1_i13.p1  ORF type:complete len:136 (-),score=4.81 TRINITY_DN286_c0_g1_i13:283-690(-)